FRHDADRIAKVSANFQTSARESVVCFERDVRIRSEREDDLLAFPRRLHQLFAQQLRGAHFHHDLSFEVGAGAKIEILVSRPAEAVGAAMNATTVAIDRIIKGYIGAI